MSAESEKAELETIFRQCGNDLTAYFARRHGGAAEDLVQESFLQLAKRLGRGEKPRSPRAYLFGIARHLSMACFRNQQTGREQELRCEEEVAAEETDERLSRAREVIAALPPLQREILDLRFMHGLSYGEMAIALAVPVGTVRSRLHNALGLLREKISTEEKSTSNL